MRLRALELIEEKDHERHGGQNDFKKALEDVDKQTQEEAAREKGKKKDKEASLMSDVLDLELVKTDPDKLYPIIYYALKRALKEWEQWMDDRPGVYTRLLSLRYSSALYQNMSRVQRRAS